MDHTKLIDGPNALRDYLQEGLTCPEHAGQFMQAIIEGLGSSLLCMAQFNLKEFNEKLNMLLATIDMDVNEILHKAVARAVEDKDDARSIAIYKEFREQIDAMYTGKEFDPDAILSKYGLSKKIIHDLHRQRMEEMFRDMLRNVTIAVVDVPAN